MVLHAMYIGDSSYMLATEPLIISDDFMWHQYVRLCGNYFVADPKNTNRVICDPVPSQVGMQAAAMAESAISRIFRGLGDYTEIFIFSPNRKATTPGFDEVLGGEWLAGN